jgi:hypothetical protein
VLTAEDCIAEQREGREEKREEDGGGPRRSGGRAGEVFGAEDRPELEGVSIAGE